MTNTRLTFFNEIHRDTLNAFYLPQEQEKFTAMPNEALKKCEEDPGRHPVVIEAGDKTVGFFVLHKGENIRDFTANPNAMVIRALSINHPRPRKRVCKSCDAAAATVCFQTLPGSERTDPSRKL
ncbi:hypothetical protein [Fictibacillus nanhaiensis]|uniref:hypothetical protein n=1 Tax=Fictibacillus nanhaiensis TaxID=742169 RepID=UPI003C2342D9